MISGQYGNWRNGRPRGDHKRNYMYMQTDGLWDDDYGSSKRGYVIEYGGMEGDPPVILSATIRMNVKENRPPTADFEVQPGPLRFGEPISFTDKSHDPEGAELTYRWAFGDNTPWVSEQHPVHTFDRPGTYIVTLIVTDPGGLSSMKTHTVVVTTDVTGRVFHDKNKDGQWDPGEEGLPGSDYVVRLVGVVIATAPDPEAGHTLDRERHLLLPVHPRRRIQRHGNAAGLHGARNTPRGGSIPILRSTYLYIRPLSQGCRSWIRES